MERGKSPTRKEFIIDKQWVEQHNDRNMRKIVFINFYLSIDQIF